MLHRVTFAICIAGTACGCIFAPTKFGARGVVLPGESQYDLYLANCSKRYPELKECCERWGSPAAIQIGHSGGYFVWRGQSRWLRVGSFGATLEMYGCPKRLLPFVQDQEASAAPSMMVQSPKAGESSAQYVLELFERKSNDSFAYDFRLRLKDGADASLSAINRIKQEMRQAVVSDYVGACGGNPSEVKVDFPGFAMRDCVIEGRAEVMRIAVQSLRYDAASQKGVIAVKIGANSFDEARKWVRRNIETLAKDKNVALTTGQVPSEARFYLGAERVRDGNVLEIEFETE